MMDHGRARKKFIYGYKFEYHYIWNHRHTHKSMAEKVTDLEERNLMMMISSTIYIQCYIIDYNDGGDIDNHDDLIQLYVYPGNGNMV